MPLKLEEKFDVTDHDQKVDDFITPSDLRKRKLAKIQSLIIDLFHNGRLLTYYFYAYDDLPFPSYKNSHFKHKAKCETFLVKKSFICIRIKIILISRALQLATLSKHIFGATRKWSIY